MKVDFLTLFEKKTDLDLHSVIADCLRTAYEDNYDEAPEQNDLDRAINIRYVNFHQRPDIAEDEECNDTYISGFSINFDTEVPDEGERLAKGFCRELVEREDVGIRHVVKLNDPYLREINRRYADDIFKIEMKLREAISMIFLDTYGDEFYELLKETVVSTAGKDVNEEQLKAHFENEFFYLLFSDYIALNERKLPNNTKDFIKIIGNTADFDSLKKWLISKPISMEHYADFLASLKEHVDPIEKVRNCVAHNRTISKNAINNYEKAKELLMKSIDDLIGYPNRDDVRMFWEEEAVDALKYAFENAKWDYENGTVEIYNSHDDSSVTCNSYDELIEELDRLGSDTASVYMPYDGGEPVFDYEPYDDIADLLGKHEEEMKALGWEI